MGGTVMSGSLWLLAKGRSLILCNQCVNLVCEIGLEFAYKIVVVG